MRFETWLIGRLGEAYNEVMQAYFGDYRFSHTIEFVYDGEPGWLDYLHREYELYKELLS